MVNLLDGSVGRTYLTSRLGSNQISFKTFMVKEETKTKQVFQSYMGYFYYFHEYLKIRYSDSPTDLRLKC